MFTWRWIAGKVVYGLACVLAAVTLVVSGFAHKVVNAAAATGKGATIGDSPSVGAMNILVMGLESRTNYYGQTLSAAQLLETHSGSVEGVNDEGVGGQDTDTLILVRIFPGGKKAVGVSIPRDDLVTYPQATYLGITQGKVDQAYDLAYNLSLQQTFGSSMSQNERYLKANQAGQLFEVQTVEALTGVHIDHYVVENLIGFYYLAKAFGGIEVCIKPAAAQAGLPYAANLTDYDPLTGTDNSGFNAYKDGYDRKKGGAQYLHLDAAQSLAYVRSRDTLPGIDIGRTKRQQAVIDYVDWKLKHDNVFSDLGVLSNLVDTASQNIMTDSNFKLLDFAGDMSALSGSHITFSTLPISGQVNNMELNGSKQDVNTVDVPYLQQYVHDAFAAPPSAKKTSSHARKTTPAPAPSTVTVNVYNGSDTNGLAADVSTALTDLGYKAGTVADASTQSQPVQAGTQVFYGAGASANAAKIAADIGATATSLTSLPARHVEVLLGTTATAVPSGLTSAGSSIASPSATATAVGNNGTTGGTTTVAANAKFGVPCVY